ncbi:MAG: site-specific integrase [Chloroflexi bacterium]|nr:site-specific integrase [Chloroflexota bacterium]
MEENMPKILKNELNPRTVATLSKAGKYNDGGGLILRIDQQGNKVWIQRVILDGRETMRGLGSYPAVSLADARRASAELKERIKTGTPPEPDVMTFAVAAEQFLEGWTRQFKSPKHALDWEKSLRSHAFPAIGDKPIDEITTGEVLAVLTPIWYTVPVMATRVRQRIEKVFDWAILHNYREKANPAGKHILTALPKRRPTEHHKALPYAEVPNALRTIELSTSLPLTRLAFRFMVLTAVRSGEARLADWAEIDWEQRTWTIPAERMKMGREHRVPLSDQALDTLRDAARVVHIHRRKQREDADAGNSTDAGLIFHTSTGGEITSAAFSHMVQRLGLDAVPHGFRSSFRSWCAEHSVLREVAEASLSHLLGDNPAETAYLRTDLLEQRRAVMQAWADFCTTRPPGGYKEMSEEPEENALRLAAD